MLEIIYSLDKSYGGKYLGKVAGNTLSLSWVLQEGCVFYLEVHGGKAFDELVHDWNEVFTLLLTLFKDLVNTSDQELHMNYLVYRELLHNIQLSLKCFPQCLGWRAIQRV